MPHLLRALELAPTDAATALVLAELLLDEGDAESAERLARESLLVAPEVVELSCLRARALRMLGRPSEAMALLARTARAAPAAPPPLLALADISLADGNLDEAATFAEAGQRLAGRPAAARIAAAGLLLRAGRRAAGWAGFAAAMPGRLAIDRKLCLLAPNNLADTLFFLRACPSWPAAGGYVRLFGAAALAGLLADVPGLTIELDAPDALDGDLLLLGAAVGPDMDGLPPPPLTVPAPAIQAWRDGLARFGGATVAIAWGGQTGLTLAEVRAAVPAGATAVSIVTGAARAELSVMPGVVDAGAAVRGYPAMAALLSAVDRVMLPDGPAAHLAGALGRRGAVFAPAAGHLAWAAACYPSLDVRRVWAAAPASANTDMFVDARA